MSTNQILESAIAYHKRGYPVFPFKRDRSKACVKWEPYQTMQPSLDDVKGWFTKRFSNEFIAIATGKYANLLVVDCDSEEAYQRISENLPESIQTPIAKTKRGYHIYFKHRDGLVTDSDYQEGVDVRTNGGCIIAPPSNDGNGRVYKWVHPGLSLEKIDPAEIPSSLFDILLQNYFSKQNLGSLIITSNSNDHANQEKQENDCRQVSSLSSNVVNLFVEGQRDREIFHLANCLIKGGYEKERVYNVLEIIAKNCNPPFDEKEIPIKIQSAMKRKQVRERNLSDEVRDFVLSSTGVFLSSNVVKCLQVSSRDEQKNVSKILSRLKADGIIEKSGTRDGEWRLVDQDCKPMDWINADCSYKPLVMPLDLGEICGVQPGNILVFAGAKDSGKTAFLLNIAKENRHLYKVHYFNSEMGAAEFKMRASNFNDISVNQWRDVSVYERSDNFADVIQPGENNLNIIDFLEVVDEFWKVASTLKKIHEKLKGALCVVALQKNPKQDLGRGGAFSLEKARLYVSLDYQHAKIISCKNFKENPFISGNPRGYTARYKLIQGCKIQKQPPGWTSGINEEA